MAEQQDLLVERRDGVLYLTLNRPDRMNALSAPMVAGLLGALHAAAHDAEIGAVVLTGAGRGFCAGGDVARMRDRNEAGAGAGAAEGFELGERIAQTRRGEEVTVLLHEMPRVTIAAVNGAVAGAGLGLCLSCDIRIAADSARFGTAFARVGYSGDWGGSYFLTQLVGSAKARELYFSAELIDAAEALRLGLVSRVVPAATLMEEAGNYAKKIAAGPRVAFGYMKGNLNAAMHADLRTILDREAVGQALTSLTEDHKEAVKAFLDKREPRFRGR
ncbi:MAG TPA: enoyl-CoA hydratase [Candidatus Binataceae bacterium]|nr:enoyl-CoA hydratase [Candidatus Binataceae bacterium]